MGSCKWLSHTAHQHAVNVNNVVMPKQKPQTVAGSPAAAGTGPAPTGCLHLLEGIHLQAFASCNNQVWRCCCCRRCTSSTPASCRGRVGEVGLHTMRHRCRRVQLQQEAAFSTRHAHRANQHLILWCGRRLLLWWKKETSCSSNKHCLTSL